MTCASRCWAARLWTPTRLLRAYIWHCIAIPLIGGVFMGVHFWRVRKDGGISGPAPVVLETEMKPERKI